MNKMDFMKKIQDSFFDNLTADFEAFKTMINSAMPVFGTLETTIKDNEDGGKAIEFVDVNEAQIMFVPEGVDATQVNTDMSSTFMTLHLNKDHVIEVVEHGFHMFTPRNKEMVLLLASMIGKKITFK